MDTGLGAKVVIVTGATRGIGRAIAQCMLEEGAHVLGTGRSEASAEAGRRALDAGADRLALVVADLADPQSPGRIVSQAREHFGQVDIVVNNAASSGFRSAGGLQPEDWLDLARSKLVGYASLIEAARDDLLANKGAVVNVAGIAGSVPTGEVPHIGAVNAAIVSATRFYAAELAGLGVRVNAVSPGDTNTDRRTERLARLQATGLSLAEARSRLAANIPMGRLVEPSEVAAAVVMLCSEPFRPVTGVNLIVDGGQHVHYSAVQ